ncbi:MAG: acyl-CoA dehydrogenase family protein [Dehalococcoidia bacterium]
MDFRFTREEEEFRKELVAFIKAEVPSEYAAHYLWAGPADWEAERRMRRKLAERGWLALGWPKEYGGQGASHMKQMVYTEEMVYHEAPGRDSTAVGFLGPCLIVYGTEEQKRQHLGPIARGEVTWAQGYSEPEAGSDLASLQTRAVEDGDDYVINGQKIWSSYAHESDWMFVLARTDPDAPKHRGITFFLLDLKTPGISLRPIVNMAGDHNFNETFFDDVRVPKANIVGEVNRGWYVGMTALNFERDGIEYSARARRFFDELVNCIRDLPSNGGSRLEDPLVRHRLAELAVEIEVARMLSYRMVWLQSKGEAPSHEASIAKLFGTELLLRVANGATLVTGLVGQLTSSSKWAILNGRVQNMYLWTRGHVIGGGTSEIQRNIIALRGLGLPRGG